MAEYHCDNCNETDPTSGYRQQGCAICEIEVLVRAMHELFKHTFYLRGCAPLPHTPGYLAVKNAGELLQEHGIARPHE